MERAQRNRIALLFGMINKRYWSRSVHMHDEMFPVSPSWAFARAAIGMMSGNVEEEAL